MSLPAQHTLKLTGRFCLENFSKDFFLLYQNWFKNKNKSSLGAKEAQENNFESYTMDFVPKTYFEEKKVVKFAQNCRNFFDIFEISKLV